MSDIQAIEAASKRLLQALDGLEAAVERRCEADRAQADLGAQVQALGSDRVKLAAELDTIYARAKRMEATNHEVADRLRRAMETIQDVIAGGKPWTLARRSP
jgi:chromosome segregation ATPase